MTTRLHRIVLLLFFSAVAVASIRAQAPDADRAGVEKALYNYLDGGTYGDTTRLDAAFHPSATMKFIDNKTGEFRDVPIADYLAGARRNAGKTLDRKTRIVSLDVSGSAAHAKVEIDGGSYVFHDYMNLLRFGDEWKIVSKIFYREERK